MSFDATFTVVVIIFLLLLVASVGFIIWSRLKDRRFMQQPTRHVLSATMKQLIEQEREENRDKKERFDQALTKARRTVVDIRSEEGGE